jgi:hypothetical protein
MVGVPRRGEKSFALLTLMSLMTLMSPINNAVGAGLAPARVLGGLARGLGGGNMTAGGGKPRPYSGAVCP